MHPNPINIFNHWVILIYLFFSPLARAMIFSTEIYDYSTKIFFFKLTPSVEMNNVAGMHIRFLFWNESQLAGELVQSYRVITFSCPCDTAIHKTHNTNRQTQKHKNIKTKTHIQIHTNHTVLLHSHVGAILCHNRTLIITTIYI